MYLMRLLVGRHVLPQLLLAHVCPDQGLSQARRERLHNGLVRGALPSAEALIVRPSSGIRRGPFCPEPAAISSSLLLIFSFRVWGHFRRGKRGAVAVLRPFAMGRTKMVRGL